MTRNELSRNGFARAELCIKLHASRFLIVGFVAFVPLALLRGTASAAPPDVANFPLLIVGQWKTNSEPPRFPTYEADGTWTLRYLGRPDTQKGKWRIEGRTLIRDYERGEVRRSQILKLTGSEMLLHTFRQIDRYERVSPSLTVKVPSENVTVTGTPSRDVNVDVPGLLPAIQSFFDALKQGNIEKAHANISEEFLHTGGDLTTFKNWVASDPTMSAIEDFQVTKIESHRGMELIHFEVTTRAGGEAPLYMVMGPGPQPNNWKIIHIQSVTKFP